jgi:hypothetical protein
MLFGMRHLPDRSGGWGQLLGVGRDEGGAEPASLNAIQSINDSFMTFSPAVETSGRGFTFILGLVIGCAGVSMVLSRVVIGGILSRADFWPYLVGVYGVILLFAGAFFAWSISSATRLSAPPVVLSRRLRKFFCWIDRKNGWVSIDYDAAQPISMVSRSYSLAGAATGYVLAVVDIEASDRRIRSYVPLAQPYRDDRAPGMIWEFIRHYMDGDPETLPPGDPLPPADDARADHVLLDRQLFGGLVDAHHRVKPGAFPMTYVCVVGALMYWFERAGLWIWRIAPRPEWPPEIRAEMSMPAPASSFRARPLTEAERLAYAGKLGYLNRRWFVLGAICTVIVFMMFAVPGIPPWFSELNR